MEEPGIDVRTGRTWGGNVSERAALRLIRAGSHGFSLLRFRGLWRYTRLIARLLGIKRRIWCRCEDDIVLSVDVRDPYWIRLIAPYFTYEPDIHTILKRINHINYLLIDGGANMGYWSSYITSKLYQKQAIAVEALQNNVDLLTLHCKANEKRFTVLHRALSDTPDQELTLYQTGGHASVSLVGSEEAARHTETVTTTTIDKIITENAPHIQNIVLKLDVEGVEVQALQGAKQVLKKQPLILYEDHGADKSSRVTDYIINVLKLDCFYLHESGTQQKITSLDMLKAIKTDKQKGYNFAACAKDSVFYPHMMEGET